MQKLFRLRKYEDTLCAIASAEALDAYIHQFVYGSI